MYLSLSHRYSKFLRLLNPMPRANNVSMNSQETQDWSSCCMVLEARSFNNVFVSLVPGENFNKDTDANSDFMSRNIY